MEHSPSDPVCILKVDVNCCKACRKKLHKKLLQVNGVREVAYDSDKKVVTVRGKCKASELIKCIGKMRKRADIVSGDKVDATTRTEKMHANAAHNSNKTIGSSSCQADSSIGGVKEKQHHEYVAPPWAVHPSVCNDQFYGGVNNNPAAGTVNGSGYWHGPPPPFGGYGDPNMASPYGYHCQCPLPSTAPPPGPRYTFQPPTQSMAPGMQFNSFSGGENPRGCATM